jgi:hypothetical protein
MAGRYSDIVLAVRGVIGANLQPGIVESPHYVGMSTWVVTEERSPRTHDSRPLPVIALGERKTYASLFLPPIHFLPGFGPWFESAWRSSGCPYRAGKASVQMKQLDDVPLDVVADAVSRLRVDELVAAFRAAFPGRSRR